MFLKIFLVLIPKLSQLRKFLYLFFVPFVAMAAGHLRKCHNKHDRSRIKRVASTAILDTCIIFRFLLLWPN